MVCLPSFNCGDGAVALHGYMRCLFARASVALLASTLLGACSGEATPTSANGGGGSDVSGTATGGGGIGGLPGAGASSGGASRLGNSGMGGTDGGAPSTSSKLGALSGACPAPVGLVAIDAATVVGDGTATSCTESALRAAVEKGGAVRFDCGSAPIVIEVTTPLHPTLDVVIDGENRVTLSGGKKSRVLLGTSFKRLTLQRLTIRDGYAEDGLGAAGVHTNWEGDLTIVQCNFIANVSMGNAERSGGGVSTHASELIVVDSVFEDNSANMGSALNILLSNAKLANLTVRNNRTRTFGGAVYIDGAGIEYDDPQHPDRGFRGAGTIELCGSELTGNTSGDTAGAFYFCGYDADTAHIDTCSITNNESAGAGGGIVTQCNSRLTIERSLVAFNRSGHGAGIWTACSAPECQGPEAERRTVIRSTTIYGNESMTKDTLGGGLYATAPVALEGVTLAKNRSYYGCALSGAENVWATDVLVADNEILNPYGTSRNCGRALARASGVLEWPAITPSQFDAPCQVGGPSGDPMLGELSDHGGRTLTAAPGPGSAALGGGTSCTGTDQLGASRQMPCDLGAFELP